MTDLNTEVRELNIDELARVTGGEAFAIHGPGPVGPGGETFD
jgi:bacteriocin-like protein